MKLKKIYMFTFLCLIITGCSILNSNENNDIKETILSNKILKSEDEYKKTDYKLFINIPRELGLYEPVEGCYIGAYILSNPDINFDIDLFEKTTGVSHGIYLRNIKLGSVFPINWILECTSRIKTPNIILQAPSKEYPYQDFLLEKTAKEFGQYFIPMFVQFYPNPQQYRDPREYKEFFKKARNIFKKYAPNVAFVWSINLDNTKDSLIYYPGDEAVDWIGINVYDTINNSEDIFEDIDFIYYYFQSKKPIMISQLGISHYSKKGHRYYIDEASDKISYFYNNIKNNYPQIKAINYMDFNNIEAAPEGQGHDNFRITSHKELIDSYKSVLNNEYFIDTIDIQNIYDIKNQWISSYYPIYERNEEFFISKNVLEYEWNEKDLFINEENNTIIDGNIYYPLKVLQQDNNLNLIIEKKKIIKIK
ncbi:glycosyl hydrolase [Defluviitalea phaphyphila]|uniref:glycosyl hydrolase n=1 Tax=Defluviitalea phaphyphila TaxID=1473580 RepID=UPI0007312676|nr:glycosyl hydrolase [Defluviitalea phaphyphila]